MQDAFEVAITSFGAVVGIVLIFAAVLGLRSWIENHRRRKIRAKADAEAWIQLCDNQLAIAPAQLTDTEAAAALQRARKLHESAHQVLDSAKKTKHYDQVRTYALAGLHNLNIMRRRLGKAPGPQGPVPFNLVSGVSGVPGRDENERDIPTGPGTGVYFY